MKLSMPVTATQISINKRRILKNKIKIVGLKIIFTVASNDWLSIYYAV